MVDNLNLGSMNNSLAGIADHAGSMAGGTTIYFRNRSNTPIGFLPDGIKLRKFEWFSTTDASTTFIKKPPSSIILPGTTSSAILYTTAAEPLSVNTIRFNLNMDSYRFEWQFDGFRRLIKDDNVIIQTKSGDDCISAHLYMGLFFSCICGYDVWIIDIANTADMASNKIDFSL